MQTVKAVLFDLDNTLVDSDAACTVWADWFARERLGLGNDRAVAEEVARIVQPDAEAGDSRTARLRSLWERHSTTIGSLDALLTEFPGQLLAELPPLDGDVGRLLAALEDAGVPWGIVSNGAPSQLEKICKLALGVRTSCVFISELVYARAMTIELIEHRANLLLHPGANEAGGSRAHPYGAVSTSSFVTAPGRVWSSAEISTGSPTRTVRSIR
jgi:phosphoglycolate phosphatase-like HAD superfamily hydrolase